MKMSKEAIRVMVRFRPINARELSEQGSFQPVIKFIDKSTAEVAPTDGAANPITFNFDQIFDMSTTQEYFYSCAGQRVVEFCFLELCFLYFSFLPTVTCSRVTMEQFLRMDKLVLANLGV